MKAEVLKEEARKFEQREEWGKALELYLRAIDSHSEEDEPEIALHNRVGDLRVRVGDLPGAVVQYEKAIDLYLEAGLPNNAIAVCRKIIRHEPRRPDPFLRMGRIRAGQGFLVDARQNFLTYVEMVQARGKGEEALSALEEFARLAPHDAEARELLAERLLSVGRPEEGITHLSDAYRIFALAGVEVRAERLLARLRELAPDRPPPSLELPAAPALEEEDAATELLGFEATSLGAGAIDTVEPVDEGASDSEIVDAYGEGPEREEGRAPALFDEPETSELDPEEDAFPAEVMEWAPTGAEEEAEEDEGVPVFPEEVDEEPAEDETPLPYLDAEAEAAAEAEGGGDGEGPPLPLLEVAEEGDEPTWGRGPGEEIEALPDLTEALRARVAEEPGDGEGWLLLGRELFDLGEASEALDALRRARDAFAAAGDAVAAERVAEELGALDPEGSAAEGSSLLADSPPEQASTEVGDGFDPPVPPAGSAPAEAVASPPEGGYVDLGALVLDEGGEATTRWTVSADAPTSDEEADFRKMLAQFKEKVAENLSAEDAKAHYDLGTAYKEMGLVEEAISEFQQALRADPGDMATFEMLGQCFLDKGEPRATIRTLERALRLPVPVEDDLLGIYYFLAKAHEGVGNPDEAREFYERIFALDINFKDVTDRLRELR